MLVVLTTRRLEHLGQALYGDDWVGSMAARLKVSRRTVERWRSGKTKAMPDNLLTVLLALVQQKRDYLRRVSDAEDGEALDHLFTELSDSGIRASR